jgi:hypothetical protein
MTELNIEQLKTAALAATPGPWNKSNHANSPRVCAPETEDRLGIEMQIRGNGNRDDNRKNAAFIAAANPAAVLELIAEVERLRAAVGSAEPEERIDCVRCAGTGNSSGYHRTEYERCPDCNGDGYTAPPAPVSAEPDAREARCKTGCETKAEEKK